jgi:hypothetical protein
MTFDSIVFYAHHTLLLFCEVYASEIPNQNQPLAAIKTVFKRLLKRVWLFRFGMIFLVACTESKHLRNNPEVINLWYIMFELASAFGMLTKHLLQSFHSLLLLCFELFSSS